MLVAAFGFAALFFASPMATAETQQQEPTTSRSSNSDAERRICKNTSKTGSHVRQKRVCLTAKQWDDTQRQGQEIGQSMQQLVNTERGN